MTFLACRVEQQLLLRHSAPLQTKAPAKKNVKQGSVPNRQQLKCACLLPLLCSPSKPTLQRAGWDVRCAYLAKFSTQKTPKGTDDDDEPSRNPATKIITGATLQHDPPVQQWCADDWSHIRLPEAVARACFVSLLFLFAAKRSAVGA